MFKGVDKLEKELNLGVEVVAAGSTGERAGESFSERCEGVDGDGRGASGWTGERVCREGRLIGGGGTGDGRVDVRSSDESWPCIRLISRLPKQDSFSEGGREGEEWRKRRTVSRFTCEVAPVRSISLANPFSPSSPPSSALQVRCRGFGGYE